MCHDRDTEFIRGEILGYQFWYNLLHFLLLENCVFHFDTECMKHIY